MISLTAVYEDGGSLRNMTKETWIASKELMTLIKAMARRQRKRRIKWMPPTDIRMFRRDKCP